MKIKITILGVNGGFGSLFCSLLSKEDLPKINGVDLSHGSRFSENSINYFSSNLTTPDEGLIPILQASDILIICLPEQVTYQFLRLYASSISAKTLLVDTLSIKKQIGTIYMQHDWHGLSLNPMFGPDLAPADRNMIVVSFKESELSKWFIGILSGWKLNLVFTTSDEHDRLSSLLQVATHAAILAFGITLTQSGQSIDTLLHIATPPFLSLATLYGRIALGNKEVYWNIQKENCYASDIRKALINNLTLLDQYIDQNNEEQFNRLTGITNEQQELLKSLQANYPTSPK